MAGHSERGTLRRAEGNIASTMTQNARRSIATSGGVSIHDAVTGVHLATLAMLQFSDGELAKAQVLYRRYLDTYPESEYAWIAALRIGQCIEAKDPKFSVEQTRQFLESLGAREVTTIGGDRAQILERRGQGRHVSELAPQCDAFLE